jgi:hypothetical protein
MLIGIIVIFLLLSNWLLSSLIFLPIDLLNYVGSFSWMFCGIVFLFILSWCLGDD